MATPVFPLSLPGVSTLDGTATNQILKTDDNQPQNVRRLTRVPESEITVSWRFLESDYSMFIDWWKNTLLYGHKWFTCKLPSAIGFVDHVVRFKTTFDGKLAGHRYWNVNAQLIVRDRMFEIPPPPAPPAPSPAPGPSPTPPPPPRPAPPPPPSGGSGIFDLFINNLWSAWGIKKLLSSYSGPLIRVRRSNDNAESDIEQNSDGSLNSNALFTFTGSNSAFVTKVYDQTGAGNHLIQTTASKQPRIVNAGTYEGFIWFDGSNDYFQSLNPTPSTQAISFALRYNLRVNQFVSGIVAHTYDDGYEDTLSWVNYSNSINCYISQNVPNDLTLVKFPTPIVNSEITELMCFDRSSLAKVTLLRNSNSISNTYNSTPNNPIQGNFASSFPLVIGININRSGNEVVEIAAAAMNMKWFGVWKSSQVSNGVNLSGLS